MPKFVHYTFAILFATIATSLAVQSGWNSAHSSSIANAVTFAALYGGIALFACYGHSIAADALMDRQWFQGGFFLFVAALAVGMTVFNDLGAIAARNDATQGVRAKVKDAVADDRAEYARLVKERDALKFSPATDADVDAARAAVGAAERAQRAECEKRGRYCREREADEQARRGELAAVLKNKADTDRAAGLKAAAEAVRLRIDHAPPVQDVNPQATILSRLTGAAADLADSWMQVALSAMLELCVAATVINLERIRRRDRTAAPTQEAATSSVEAPPSPARVPGSVARFMDGHLPPAKGKRTSLTVLGAAFAAWCERHGFTAHDAETFKAHVLRICTQAGIRTKTSTKGDEPEIYLLDVHLSV